MYTWSLPSYIPQDMKCSKCSKRDCEECNLLKNKFSSEEARNYKIIVNKDEKRVFRLNPLTEGAWYKHMVRFHEDAYWLNNLSLFALNIERHWGQKNKSMVEIRPPVLLSISLEYWKIFFSLQDVPKMVWIMTFNFRKWRKKGQNLDHFWDTCNEKNIF